MEKEFGNGLLEALGELPDPRTGRENKFMFAEIVFAAVVSVVCGAASWWDMAYTSRRKLEWLRRYLPYTNGTPGEAVFRRVFQALDPKKAHEVFAGWTRSVVGKMGVRDSIAIDGKTARGSGSGAESALHVVSAVATGARLVLGQVACGRKSSEIVAIPELLDLLDIGGCLVTIDAMGTQRTVADRIVAKGGDFLLPVKGNQKNLFKDVRNALAGTPVPKDMRAVVSESSHGRDTTWECGVVQGREWMDQKTAAAWPEARFCAVVTRTSRSGGRTSVETRCYVGSREGMGAGAVLAASRAHWGVESFHWTLDVQFGEDASKVHADHSAENLNVLRHYAYNIIRSAPRPARESVRKTMRRCDCEDDVLTRVMGAAR